MFWKRSGGPSGAQMVNLLQVSEALFLDLHGVGKGDGATDDASVGMGAGDG